MEVHNTVPEAVTKTILKKKKCRKGKWLSEKALQIAEKKKEKQGRKGEIYQLNAEFQRRSKRDKETFLNAKRRKQ